MRGRLLEVAGSDNAFLLRGPPTAIGPGRSCSSVLGFVDQAMPASDPNRLSPFASRGLLQVIVETPAGSRNKFAWDAERGIFHLRKTLPAGMVFPYDFGFVPQTRAPDGDPLDVLLLMDQPAFPGCLVTARLLGVIEGEQMENGKAVRNDRLVAVAEATHEYARIRRLADLPKKWTDELQQFFVNYSRLEGREYRLLGRKGSAAALRLVQQASAGQVRSARGDT